MRKTPSTISQDLSKFVHLKNQFIKELCVLFLILGATLFSTYHLFQTGFFRTIDDVTTVRIDHMRQSLVSPDWQQNFPVRWSGELAHGYGYPLFLYYAPLPYYLGAGAMIWLGLSDIVATKLIYALPLLFGAFLFYAAARQQLSRAAATIGALLFAFFPYRGYNAYIRGGVGESWAIALIPAVFLGIFLLKKHPRLGTVIFSISFALVCISHTLVALQLGALILLYGVIFFRKSLRFWLSILLGLGVAAFYLIPMGYYLNSVNVTTTEPNTGKLLTQLQPLADIFTIPLPFTQDLRYSGVLTYFLLLIFSMIFWRRQFRLKTLALFFWSSISLLLLLLTTQVGYAIWRLTLPVTQILQFPWRVLSLVSFSLPFSIALSWHQFSSFWYRIFIGISVIVLTLYFFPTFQPMEYTTFYNYSAEESGPCATTTWEDEYLPRSVRACGKEQTTFLRYNAAVTSQTEVSSTWMSGIIESSETEVLTVNKYLFPGWVAFVDSEEQQLSLTESEHGTFQFTVPAGKHEFQVQYRKTPIMILADVVSTLSLLFLSGYSLKLLIDFLQTQSFHKFLNRIPLFPKRILGEL